MLQLPYSTYWHSQEGLDYVRVLLVKASSAFWYGRLQRPFVQSRRLDPIYQPRSSSEGRRSLT
jgi:hypothetical protein